MAGRILFEDEEYILADFSDNFRVDIRLVLKREHRTAIILVIPYDIQVIAHIVLTMDRQGNRLKIRRYYAPSEYLALRNKLLKIKTPRDFVINFIELISPQIAKVIE